LIRFSWPRYAAIEDLINLDMGIVPLISPMSTVMANGRQATQHQALNHLEDDLSSLSDSCLFQFPCALQQLEGRSHVVC
jgi:hypothetical protein